MITASLLMFFIYSLINNTINLQKGIDGMFLIIKDNFLSVIFANTMCLLVLPSEKKLLLIINLITFISLIISMIFVKIKKSKNF